MGTNVSKATGEAYRGFIVPDPEITLSTDPADRALYTQANPRPGSPVAYRQTDMVLETSGDSMTGAELHLATIQGGMPGVQEAGFVWTNQTPYTTAAHSAAGGAWRGWDAPGAVSQFEGQIGAPNDVVTMSCITLQNGIILMACVDNTSSAVRIFKRSTAGVWTNSTIGATSSGEMPCMLQLPEGRVHLYLVLHVTANATGTSGQVRLWVSDDDATSWQRSTQQCLAPIPGAVINPINLSGSLPDAAAVDGEVTLRRMRVCYSQGQVMLLIAATFHNDTLLNPLNQWIQYASSDLGHSFDYITTYSATGVTDTHAGGFHDIVAPKSGGFVVVYCSSDNTGTDGKVCSKSFSSAYQEWSTVAPTVLVTSAVGTLTARGLSFELTDTDCTAAIDQTGAIWVSYRSSIPANESKALASFDNGATWANVTADYGFSPGATKSSWYSDGNLGGSCSAYPRAYCSTFQWGRWVIIALSHIAGEGNGTDVGKPIVFYLGGYTSITRPFQFDSRSDLTQMVYEENWMAFTRPNDVATWARTAVGAPTTEALNNGFFRTVTGAGVTVAYQNTVIRVDSDYMFFLFEWNTVAGNSDVKIRVSNGAQGFEMWVTMTTTNIVFKDIVAGTALVTVPRPSTGQNQVYICIDRAGLKMRAGTRAGSTSEDRGLFVSTASYALADSGAVAAGDRVILHTQQNSTIDWNLAQWGSGDFGQNPESTFPNTDTEAGNYKYWRSWSAYPLYVNGGVSVAAVDGPSWPRYGELSTGDRWDITPRYEYAIENTDVFVTPTPRKTWRSTSTATQAITYKIGDGLQEIPMPRVLGVALFNCNLSMLKVKIFTGGAWSTFATCHFSRYESTSLNYSWDGNRITPTVSGPDTEPEWTTHSSLVGGWFSGTGGSSKIVANSEGNWYDDAGVSLVLTVEDSRVETGSSGEVYLKDTFLVLHDLPTCSKIRLETFGLPATTYYEIGTIVLGSVEYLGKQYARGRTITDQQNYNLTTGRSGTRRGRKLGPKRRVVEFSWANENVIDSTQISVDQSGTSADYILSATSGGNIVASPADTAYKMMGVVNSQNGAVVPMVYVSNLVVEDPPSYPLTGKGKNPDSFMLCRVTSDPRIETVAGDEWSTTKGKGEVMRIATVTLEEEV